MSWKEVSIQKFEAIMRKNIQLDLCPNCRGPAEIVVKIPWYGQTGARVQCSKCGYGTRLYNIHSEFHCEETKSIMTPILEKSIIAGIRKAVQEWNIGEGTDKLQGVSPTPGSLPAPETGRK